MAHLKADYGSLELSLSTADGRTQCLLCPHRCSLREGQYGACKVRQSVSNAVVLSAYGQLGNVSVEPIEKKPLYHYKPGLRTLSVGGFGCPLRCGFCENSSISQSYDLSSAKYFDPNALIELAIQKQCKAICFTYNEPIVYFEYLIDVAELCHKYDLDVILKTSAYIEKEPWNILSNYIDAVNIDWKGTEAQYQSIAKVDSTTTVKRLLESIERGTHVEISMPIYIDSTAEEFSYIRDLIHSVNKSIAIHLLKIVPAYKFNLIPVTSNVIIDKVHAFLSQKLDYVYTDSSRDTVCKKCLTYLVKRKSLIVEENNKKCCSDCPIHF